MERIGITRSLDNKLIGLSYISFALAAILAYYRQFNIVFFIGLFWWIFSFIRIMFFKITSLD